MKCTSVHGVELRGCLAEPPGFIHGEHQRLKDKYGKEIIINNVRFKYGQENIDLCKTSYMGTTKGGKPQKYYQAMTHRFYRTEHGWYLLTTVDVAEKEKISCQHSGAIGIDFNVNFAQLTVVDRFGNPTEEISLKYNMYGKHTEQILANMGDLARDICNIALEKKLPIYIENLKLEDCKQADKERKYNRMINSFPYKLFRTLLEARAYKTGVVIDAVNPKYTSIIGHFKFMRRYGLSSHGAAACIIARRGMNYKTERLNKKNKTFLLKHRPYVKWNVNHYKLWMQLSTVAKSKLTFNERISKLYTQEI